MRHTGAIALLLWGTQLLLAHSVFAQNPELVDELIETPVMSVGLAARFLYQVDNPGSVALASTSNEEATIWATERGLIRSSVAAQDVASYAVVSRMMVEYIGFSTSTMYWLTGLPRYALRELSFRQLVSPTVSEDHTMSGEQFMMLLARSFDWRERFRPGAHKDET